MVRRRVLSDGHIFLEQRDARGELVAETVVPPELEADAEALLAILAAKWEALTADRLPPGVLPFRRRLAFAEGDRLGIPARSQ